METLPKFSEKNMFEILKKEHLAAKVFRYDIMAPDIAQKTRPGQFVIIRLDETGERIPLTISDSNPKTGTLTFYVQAVGKTSIEMSLMNAGDSILDVVGPLGNPSEMGDFGTVVLIGGGFGIAAIYPIARELRSLGNKTISILGARTKELIFLEKEMRNVSSEIRLVTNDGSCGTRGMVTDVLDELIASGEPIDRVIAIGPLIMMKATAELTREFKIPTVVSLNPIMIDGTGMCGACRVMVGNEMKFACVDGPEFDGHIVDFDGLFNRLQAYVPEEAGARAKFLRETGGPCRLESPAPSLKVNPKPLHS